MLRLSRLCLSIWFVLAPTLAYSLTFSISELDNGSKVISVEGDFTPSDDFSEFIRLAEKADSSTTMVTFDSPGGNPSKAIALGRMIRLAGFATVQPRNGECASACALAFMGGVTRVAQPGSIGVHKSSFTETSNLSVADAVSYIQHQTAETIAYMTSMGIDPAILQLSLSYESDDIRYLSKSEMEHYRIVTGPPASTSTDARTEIQITQPSLAPQSSPQPTRQRTTAAQPQTLPTPKTGKLRVPKGHEYLRLGESQHAAKRIRLNNGAGVQILGVGQTWYRVRAGGELGYLHHNWVKVDQFAGSSFEARHVQIKSFEHQFEVAAYIRASSLPLAAYLATNGWYAITLERSYDKDYALRLLKVLKGNGTVPEDSFVTTGNTYMVKMCCD